MNPFTLHYLLKKYETKKINFVTNYFNQTKQFHPLQKVMEVEIVSLFISNGCSFYFPQFKLNKKAMTCESKMKF